MRTYFLRPALVLAILISGRLAVADEPAGAADERELAAAPADWFVADPYPDLGFDSTFGDGMHFIRLASHHACQAELKITAEQMRTLANLRKAHEQLDTDKQQELIREFGRLPSEEWIKWRKQNWSDARELAGALMGDAAKQRLEQLLVQKQGMRAFTDPQMAEKLSLNDAQRGEVRKAIVEHSQRVKKLEADLAAAERAIDKPEAERAAELLRLRKEKNQAGVASFRRNWDDVYHVLTAEQRAKYLELRGKLVTK
jgi:hypothetical protein